MKDRKAEKVDSKAVCHGEDMEALVLQEEHAMDKPEGELHEGTK